MRKEMHSRQPLMQISTIDHLSKFKPVPKTNPCCQMVQPIHSQVSLAFAAGGFMAYGGIALTGVFSDMWVGRPAVKCSRHSFMQAGGCMKDK